MKKIWCGLLSFFLFFELQAQDGSPDSSFGNNGIALIPSPYSIIHHDNVVEAVAIQQDGRIVTAGIVNWEGWNLFQIARFLSNGTLDTSFGSDGLVQIDPSEVPNDGGQNTPYGLVIADDGKIIIVGSRNSFFIKAPSGFGTSIIRLNANGSPDITFGGGDGKVILNLSASNVLESGRDVLIQPDGKIVVAGWAYDGSKNVMTVVRLLVNGTPDNGFDSDGKIYVNFAGATQGFGIALQPDGKILGVGTSANPPYSNDIAVVRLNTDGSYDNNFGISGKLLLDLGLSNDQGMDIALQPDGKIVISGSSSGNLAFIRLLSNGARDNSFDGDGTKTIDAGGNDIANTVVIQPDGKLLFGGSKDPGFGLSARIVLVKLNADGSRDNSFDMDGIAIHDLEKSAFANDIALQTNGRIIAAGYGFLGVPPAPALQTYGGIIMRVRNTLSTCSNSILVTKINATIADVYAVNPGGEANTIYKGYGTQSLTLTVSHITGNPPYQYSWSNGSSSSSINVNPALAGVYNYSVTITDAIGCTMTLNKQVKVTDVRCGNKMDKVLVCKSNASGEVCIAANAVPAHLQNGGRLGVCIPASITSTNLND